MGLYLDIEQMYKKAQKKNNLKVGVLLDMIETCESKLKLKEISGYEGRTN